MTDHIRTFQAFVASVEDGELHKDLSEQLSDIVAALEKHQRDVGGKPTAALALTFNFKLEGGLLEIQCDFKTKLPKTSRAKSIFWTTPENNLSRRNPRQQELPLRSVEESTALRNVQ